MLPFFTGTAKEVYVNNYINIFLGGRETNSKTFSNIASLFNVAATFQGLDKERERRRF